MLNSHAPIPLPTLLSRQPETLSQATISENPGLHQSSGFDDWYALWTRSRHERVVREQLTKKGIEAFLPTIVKWGRWKDRRKQVEWPLFPGYCFARFNGNEALAVLKCMGVVTIVSFNGKPAPVSAEELNNLRRAIETDLAYDPCPLTREGMMVDVIDGPLKGIAGRLVYKNAARATVMLGVELINQAVRVEVEAAHIRPQ